MSILWTSGDLEPVPAPGRPVIEVEVGGEFIFESRIRIYNGEKGLQVQILTAQDEQVCSQLEELHESGSYATLEAAVDAIDVAWRTDLGPLKKEKMLEHLTRLNTVEVTTTPSDTLYLPSRSYRLSIQGVAGRVLVEFTEAEPLAEGAAYWGPRETAQPGLQAWVRTLLSILDIQLVPETDAGEVSSDPPTSSSDNPSSSCCRDSLSTPQESPNTGALYTQNQGPEGSS